MDFLQKIGGRKFLLAVVVLGIGYVIEIQKPEGMSPTFAGFLAAIVASFGAANYAVTKQHMQTKSGGNGGADEKLDEILSIAKSGQSQEAVTLLTNTLLDIQRGVAEIKATSTEVGQGVLNTQKVLNQIMVRK